jgi:hypothetical protein
VSDDILSVIPTESRWQPGREQADRARELLAEFAPDPDRDAFDLKAEWHETITVVDCGANLERITCPLCGTDIDPEWWGDLLDERYEEGFDDLTADVPCCGGRTSLNNLQYEWPCGFARFELTLWNLGRGWLTDQELSIIARALGHPVRQIMAHI